MEYTAFITSYCSAENIMKIVRIISIFVIGLSCIRILMHTIKRTHIHISEHVRFLLMRGVKYAGIFILAIMILSEFGFHIGTILGVAGIAGAALGFAAQTSLSNIISGLFLLTERSFGLGDQITVSGASGTVVSIGLLSIKIQQSDGMCVRVPNEHLIKNVLINSSYFEKRRFELRLTLAVEEQDDRVIALIQDVIQKNKYALLDDAPVVYVETIKESGIVVFVGVWSKQAAYTKLKRTIVAEIIHRCKQENIMLSYPFLTVSMKQ